MLQFMDVPDVWPCHTKMFSSGSLIFTKLTSTHCANMVLTFLMF